MSDTFVTVQGIARWLKRYGFDLALVLLLAEGLYEMAARETVVDGPLTTTWLGYLAVGALAVPLFARRRFPFAAPVAVWLIGAGISFVDGNLISSSFGVYVLGATAAFLLGNLDDQGRSMIGLGVVLVGSVIVVANDPMHAAMHFVTIPATFAIAWLAGFSMHIRTEQTEAAEQRASAAERERETVARIAVAEERARITRELHDIVAHAMSVIVLQVGAVRHRLPADMAEDRAALQSAEDTGRSALAEMRRLLGVIGDRDHEAELSPQPGLDRLDALVEEIGRAGLDVRLHVEGGARHVPRAIDLSAYRIVQEGLTNVLKHAGATSADVTVRYSSDDLQVEVLDDGVGPAAGDGLGRGLMGIRERVKIYRGEMSAGVAPDGGYLLSVRLPIGGNGS